MFDQLFSDKTLLVLVTLGGMALCSVGINHVAARGAWFSPTALLAYLTGALILLIVGAALFDVPIFFVDSARTALFAVVALVLFKVGLTQVHRVLA